VAFVETGGKETDTDNKNVTGRVNESEGSNNKKEIVDDNNSCASVEGDAIKRKNDHPFLPMNVLYVAIGNDARVPCLV